MVLVLVVTIMVLPVVATVIKEDTTPVSRTLPAAVIALWNSCLLKCHGNQGSLGCMKQVRAMQGVVLINSYTCLVNGYYEATLRPFESSALSSNSFSISKSFLLWTFLKWLPRYPRELKAELQTKHTWSLTPLHENQNQLSLQIPTCAA